MSRPLCHRACNAAILPTALLASIFEGREVLRHDHIVPLTISLGPSIITGHLTDCSCDRYHIILNNLGSILSREIIACHQFPVNINPLTLIYNVLVSSASHKVVSVDWYSSWTLKNIWTSKSIHDWSVLDNSCSLRSDLVGSNVVRHLFDTRLNAQIGICLRCLRHNSLLLWLAPSTTTAVDGVLIMHLLISLGHDRLGQIVGIISGRLHRPDQHISVVPVVINGRNQSLLSGRSGILLWNTPLLLLHWCRWFIFDNARSVWRDILVWAGIVHELILSENAGSSSSCNTNPVGISSSTSGHILGMWLVVVCPDVAIEVLVHSACCCRTGHVSFGPGLRLSHSGLVSSRIQHFRRQNTLNITRWIEHQALVHHVIVGSHLNDLALPNRERLVYILSIIARGNLLYLNVLTIPQVIVLRYSIVLPLIATAPICDCGIPIGLWLTFQVTVWMQRRVLDNGVIVNLLRNFVVRIIIRNPRWLDSMVSSVRARVRLLDPDCHGSWLFYL